MPPQRGVSKTVLTYELPLRYLTTNTHAFLGIPLNKQESALPRDYLGIAWVSVVVICLCAVGALTASKRREG